MAAYLIMKGQDAQRDIPIGRDSKKDWSQFNCVVEVLSKKEPQIDSLHKPWLSWRQTIQVETIDHRSVFYLYLK